MLACAPLSVGIPGKKVAMLHLCWPAYRAKRWQCGNLRLMPQHAHRAREDAEVCDYISMLEDLQCEELWNFVTIHSPDTSLGLKHLQYPIIYHTSPQKQSKDLYTYDQYTLSHLRTALLTGTINMCFQPQKYYIKCKHTVLYDRQQCWAAKAMTLAWIVTVTQSQ